MRNCAGELGRHASIARQPTDACALGSVTHHEEHCVLDASHRVNGLLQCVETAEAAHPSDDELLLQGELLSLRARPGMRSEEAEVDAGGRDEDSFVAHTQPVHLLGHDVAAARDDIGRAQRR